MFIYHNSERNRIWRALNKKLELKLKQIGVALYLLCFGIIAYEFHLQIERGIDGWSVFQSLQFGLYTMDMIFPA